MREISCRLITDTVKEMCIQATHFLSDDMCEAMNHAIKTETSPLGQMVLKQLEDNLKIAGEEIAENGRWSIYVPHYEGENLEEKNQFIKDNTNIDFKKYNISPLNWIINICVELRYNLLISYALLSCDLIAKNIVVILFLFFEII